MDGAPKKKVRYRRVDQLKSLLNCIENGELDILQTELKSDARKRLFTDRLQANRVAKDSSPLVIAVMHDKYDVFKYILDTYEANLEQETSAVIEGGYPVEGATPLWTASTLGRLEFVKLLVSRGVDIEHTTDSKSSPLRGAAFDGHCDVCEYLIDRGADIDKPNQVGQSPLTIAAAMKKEDCVQLLIKKGANVNHRGHNGDTPLHVSVESGAVEIAKVLVKAGAKNDPNDVGFTPAILACCYGHHDVMDYLNRTFKLQPMELYNCYCLLAAKEILGNHDQNAEKWLKEAIVMRQKHSDKVRNIPPAAAVYDGLQEPSTLPEIQHIMQDETRMFFLSSIYCERILGRVHPTTAFYIRISGDMALAEDRYSKCMELWHRSLEFDNAARMAYELQITEDLLFSIRGFSIMANNSFVPIVQLHFQWGLKEFHLAHESKISEIDVVCCLSRMIAAWLMVAKCVKERERKEEIMSAISRAVEELLLVMESNRCPILVACLQNLPENGSGACKDVAASKLPLHKTLALLIDHGCSVHCEDNSGNFPLHLAVQLKEDSALNCVKTLLEYRAHPDAVNFDGHTALDLAREKTGYADLKDSIVEELQQATVRYTSLQCLASKAVVAYGLDYASILPAKLVEFVSWHDSDTAEQCSGKVL